MLASILKLVLAVSWFADGNVMRAAEPAPPPLQCFSTAQTREHIILYKLVEPFASMLAVARAVQGDPIGVRLCRIGDEFIYEISLLRHDGHVMKILVDAATGKPHARGLDR
jgi:hypothetical protein